MRNLLEYASECMEMLDIIGIEYGNVIRWEVNTRAKKRFGQTRYLGCGDYEINIASFLLDESNDETGLENTIIHELLHTCKGCMNHGENWKRLARKVKQEYGYDIQRCNTFEEQGVVNVPAEKIIPKYVFKCMGCGQIVQRSRNSKFVRNYKNYSCGYCHSDLERIL